MNLSNLHRVEVAEILGDLPDIQTLNVARDMQGEEDLYLIALGFEGRCPWIAELLADGAQYRATRAIYFEYDSNRSDNDLNRGRLVRALGRFSSSVRPLACDTEEFASDLRGVLAEVCGEAGGARVTFDISVCTTRLLITTLTVLFEFDISLRIVYAEAATYHPTKEEYEAEPERWTKDDALGLARGVSSVTRSPDHPGRRLDVLPEAVIAFPTFKPERIRAILADVDESLLVRPEKRVVWLVGDPHLEEDRWRADAQRNINEIGGTAVWHLVSTFDYKKTLEILELVYRPFDCRNLVNIAPLGSKMQSLGVVMFWQIRRDVSVYFASPREYNAAQYSEGCKATWRIEVGSVVDVRRLLSSVGELRIGGR